MAPETQLIEKYDESIEQVEALGSEKELRNFFAYSPSQRLVWFVFGAGSFFLFFALLISFANLVFLDFAYEQVAKIKGILNYILKNVSQFPVGFALAFFQIPMRKNNKENSILVESHELSRSLPRSVPSHAKVIQISLLKPLPLPQRVLLRGYSFFYSGKIPSWNLKYFSLPLPLGVLSIVYLASLMFWYGGANELMTILPTTRLGSLFALGCLLSFSLLVILTLQGLFTFYMRVSNLVGLVFLLCLFILGSSFSVGYYAILAVFASIALLDYVYDWRGKKILNF